MSQPQLRPPRGPSGGYALHRHLPRGVTCAPRGASPATAPACGGASPPAGRRRPGGSGGGAHGDRTPAAAPLPLRGGDALAVWKTVLGAQRRRSGGTGRSRLPLRPGRQGRVPVRLGMPYIATRSRYTYTYTNTVLYCEAAGFTPSGSTPVRRQKAMSASAAPRGAAPPPRAARAVRTGEGRRRGFGSA